MWETISIDVSFTIDRGWADQPKSALWDAQGIAGASEVSKKVSIYSELSIANTIEPGVRLDNDPDTPRVWVVSCYMYTTIIFVQKYNTTPTSMFLSVKLHIAPYLFILNRETVNPLSQRSQSPRVIESSPGSSHLWFDTSLGHYSISDSKTLTWQCRL